jgi:hypothetical protein
MPAAMSAMKNSGYRMATRLPPVHALSAFEAAARFGSFAVAAEELCITLPRFPTAYVYSKNICANVCFCEKAAASH